MICKNPAKAASNGVVRNMEMIYNFSPLKIYVFLPQPGALSIARIRQKIGGREFF